MFLNKLKKYLIRVISNYKNFKYDKKINFKFL